jgi:fermentation-respiration switch protein FrsA (DUF1100 family)
MFLLTLFLILAFLAAVVLLIAYVCYRMAFFASRKVEENADEFAIPEGDIYEPFRDVMVQWMKEARAMPHDEVTIQSFDGLTLCGKYYEFAPGAPIELMFHGYRGNADRDLCGGVQRCFTMGYSALVVDQRGAGKSGGKVITFGIKEHLDCLKWIEFAKKEWGEDISLILTGVSMGAATVLTAAARPLPKNVKAILADCGYTSAKEIIQVVISRMGLPVKPAYFLVKLGARLFGRFNLEEISPREAMEHCTVPVIFFHGEADDFVPCSMSQDNYNACHAPKRIYTFPQAGHCLGYMVDQQKYLEVLTDFYNSIPGLPPHSSRH